MPWSSGWYGMHLDVDAGDLGGDVGRGDVGLLGGETALLDRPGRHVADRPDAVDTTDAAVAVHRHEAPGVMRQSGDPRASQARERDHEIQIERAFRLEPQLSVRVLGREGARCGSARRRR